LWTGEPDTEARKPTMTKQAAKTWTCRKCGFCQAVEGEKVCKSASCVARLTKGPAKVIKSSRVRYYA
jgi:hypothetical protein